MAVNQLDLFQQMLDTPVLHQIHDLKEKQNRRFRAVFQKYDLLQREIDYLRDKLEKVCSLHSVEFDEALT